MKIVKCKSGNIMLVLKEIESVDDKLLKANDVDASFEKHVPQFEVMGQNVKVFVNHVMEEDHFIEWLLVDYGDKQIINYFAPGSNPSMIVEYRSGMKAYSYCNKHSLWVSEDL